MPWSFYYIITIRFSNTFLDNETLLDRYRISLEEAKHIMGSGKSKKLLNFKNLNTLFETIKKDSLWFLFEEQSSRGGFIVKSLENQLRNKFVLFTKRVNLLYEPLHRLCVLI